MPTTHHHIGILSVLLVQSARALTSVPILPKASMTQQLLSRQRGIIRKNTQQTMTYFQEKNMSKAARDPLVNIIIAQILAWYRIFLQKLERT